MQNIKQDGSMLHIIFNQPRKNIRKVYVRNEFDSISYEDTEGDLHFKIDLKEVASVFKKYESNKLYIVVEESTAILTTQKNLKVNNSQSEVHNLSEIVNDKTKIHPYITRNGFLHLSMNEYSPQKVYFSRRHIDTVKVNNQEVILEGQFSILNSKLESANLLIKTRLTEKEKSVNFIPKLKGNKKNISTYDFSLNIYNELIEFMKYPFENEDVIDIYLNINIQESFDSVKIKLGNPRILVERFLKGEVITDFQNEIISITPYLTMKGRNLSFRINRYSIVLSIYTKFERNKFE
ncbi:hypothetical protein ACWKSJ_14170 (plasmid) [Staphylococcus equorum]